MRIKTANPVYINRNRANATDMYLSLDGMSTSSDISAFQSFANSKGAKLSVDGKWGPKTKAAWAKYGSSFSPSSAPSSTATTQTTTATTTQTPATNPTLAATSPTGQKNPGHFWDKAKGAWVKAQGSGMFDQVKGMFGGLFGGAQQTTDPNAPVVTTDPNAGLPGADPNASQGMSKKTKILIGVGAGVALIAIIYFATKKKK